MTTAITTYSYQQSHFQGINNEDEKEISITEIESETEIEANPEQDKIRSTVINKNSFRCTIESCTATFAKKCYLKAQSPGECVEMYNRAAKWEQAFRKYRYLFDYFIYR